MSRRNLAITSPSPRHRLAIAPPSPSPPHRLAIPSNVIRPSVEMPRCPSKNVQSALSMRRDELGPWQTPLEWGDGVAAPRCSAARKRQHGCGGLGFACLIEPRNHLYVSAWTLPWSPCLHGSHSPEWGWRRVCDRPTKNSPSVVGFAGCRCAADHVRCGVGQTAIGNRFEAFAMGLGWCLKHR